MTIDAIQQWLPQDEESRFLELADLRHLSQGWSLRCRIDVRRKGSELLRVGWSDVIDFDVSTDYLAGALRLGDDRSAPESSVVPLLDTKRHPTCIQECTIAAALVLCSLTAKHVDDDGDISQTSFAARSRWVSGVVEDCGDLAIPLCWSIRDSSSTSCVTQKDDLDLYLCGDTLSESVRRDVAAIRLWFNDFFVLLQQSDVGKQVVADFTDAAFRRYVAWVRSRWICFPLPHVLLSSSVARCWSISDSVRYAVVPLVEKLNHHPHSVMCPTVEPGEFVSLRADWNDAAPNRLARGDEVFISYGALTNEHLLSRYGFLLGVAENPAEVVDVRLPPLRQDVLDRWRVSTDSVTGTWRLTHSVLCRAVAAAGETLDPPVPILFTAMLHCVSSLVDEGLLSPPAAATVISDDDDDDGVMCGFFGEGSSSEHSWVYDERRMHEWMQLRDGESCGEATRAARRFLGDLVARQWRDPALRCLEKLNDMDLSSQLGESSRWWAATFATQRLAVASGVLRMLNAD